ncbi:hypothetical protein [Spirillospora sp. NPDC047279]|uniref:hypothetical protein n=1 Tax=Spirillospora sp. NPDC047279 TaxID=3155478 RepID=UPI0033EA1F7A
MMTMSVLRVSRKWVPIFLASFSALVAASSIEVPAAWATEVKGERQSSRPGVGAMAWYPSLTPFYADKEKKRSNLTGAQRSAALNNCPNGYLCIAAGEGDGRHTVYELYYCPQRALSDFIDAGAVVNNQTWDAWVVLERKDGSQIGGPIAPWNKIVPVNWRPVWYIDPC